MPALVPQARGALTLNEVVCMGGATPAELARLEDDVVRETGAPHAVVQPSARVGLVRALCALRAGDEVLVSAFNYPPLVALFRQRGWVPVLVDVAAGSTAACPVAMGRHVGPRTRAIVATHAFGRPAPMAAYRTIADRHGLLLVEDAAQAWGAAVGRWGDAAVYSFGPTKPLSAWGGGVLTTSSASLAARLRRRSPRQARGYRTWRGALFELLSRGRPLPADLTRWTTDGPGPVSSRPWHTAPLDPACAALVRARMARSRAATEARVQALGRLTHELRALGFESVSEPAGTNGFGALVRHPHPARAARALRARGLGATTRELRALGDGPVARALEASLIRVRVPSPGEFGASRAARKTRYPPRDDREDRSPSA